MSLLAFAWILWNGSVWAVTSGHDDHATHEAPEHEAIVQERHGSADSSIDPAPQADQIRYSLFMHHTCGLALLGIGALVLADRVTQRRYCAIRMGMGAVWLTMGIHILINADPTHWPIGAGFMESFSKPATDEWVPHKLLSLIPMGLGLVLILTPYRAPKPYWNFAASTIMAFGGIGLLVHMHQHQPGIEWIERQHQVMAGLSFFIAACSLMDGIERFTWRLKFYLLPMGLMFLGLQLSLYTE